MAGTVLAGPALARAIRSDFIDTWAKRYDGIKKKLGACMEFGVPSDNIEEIYGYGEVPIYPRRMAWGQAPERKPHKYRTFFVENYRWGAEVEWLRRDRELSNLGSIESDSRRAGDNFGTLEERVFFQVIQAGADRQLLEAVPSAPDGAAMYATTAEGAARFGVTGGNIESGEVFTTGAGFRTAFVNVCNRFLDFQDQHGEPLHDPSVCEDGITIIYTNSLRESYMEAFEQTLTSQVVSTSNAGVSNFLLDTGHKVTGYASQRITLATEVYMFLDSPEVKPVFSQVAKPLWEMYYDDGNSPQHGREGRESINYEQWMGFGVNLPLSTIKATT